MCGRHTTADYNKLWLSSAEGQIQEIKETDYISTEKTETP